MKNKSRTFPRKTIVWRNRKPDCRGCWAPNKAWDKAVLWIWQTQLITTTEAGRLSQRSQRQKGKYPIAILKTTSLNSNNRILWCRRIWENWIWNYWRRRTKKIKRISTIRVSKLRKFKPRWEWRSSRRKINLLWKRSKRWPAQIRSPLLILQRWLKRKWSSGRSIIQRYWKAIRSCLSSSNSRRKALRSLIVQTDLRQVPGQRVTIAEELSPDWNSGSDRLVVRNRKISFWTLKMM